jgi:phosphoserine phosphatase
MSKQAPSHVATFIAAPGERLTADAARTALAAAGVLPTELRWLDEGAALDAFLAGAAPTQVVEAALAPQRVDVIVQPLSRRRKALLVADMDATMIVEESLDELARLVGVDERVARLTEQAMRGDIGFEQALAERVALFEGVAMEAIDEIAASLTPSPGAATLVATMRAHGAHTALVSGGFMDFAQRVAARLRFDAAFANSLEVGAGRLIGRVAPPIRGAAAKAEALESLRSSIGVSREATLAIGDGANDLDMLLAAGLGVAYRAKPRVAAAAPARLNHADLTGLLYAQGFTGQEFVKEAPENIGGA